MFLTIKKRLEVLIETQKRIADGTIKFNPDKANFGFRRMKQLFSVARDEIKGFPCLAFNKFSDPVKYGIKIIPSELKYDDEKHPTDVELGLLKEFTTLVKSYITPHITFYFTDMRVPNKKQVMLDFPLKSIRKQIFAESRVLVAEYVNGSSVHEWIQHQPNLTEKQWKYLIFSMAWTLFVLQDKYKFLHSDFHYGNVLIDTNIDSADKTFYQYVLKRTPDDPEPYIFSIQNVGILPKLWDCEFGATFDPDNLFENKFFQYKQDNVPAYYNPYYDMHCFLVSLLELDNYLPERVKNFIYSIYPEDVLPPKAEYDSDDSCSTSTSSTSSGTSSSSDSSSSYTSSLSKTSSLSSSSDTSCSETESSDYTEEETSSSQSSCSCCTDIRYYKKDEQSTQSENPTGGGSVYEGSGLTKSCDESQSSDDCNCSFCKDQSDVEESESRRDGTETDEESKREYCSQSCSCCTKESALETSYIHEERLINGTEKIFKLPTPFDIITNDYFADYTKPLMSISEKRKCVFSYTMSGKPYPGDEE